jgi:tRNA U38,U39,U40 pseudouridine synthase TruA
MIGYALDVARRTDLPVSYIQDMLKKPNAQQTLTKADGCGLCLRKVNYTNELFIK